MTQSGLASCHGCPARWKACKQHCGHLCGKGVKKAHGGLSDPGWVAWTQAGVCVWEQEQRQGQCHEGTSWRLILEVEDSFLVVTPPAEFLCLACSKTKSLSPQASPGPSYLPLLPSLQGCGWQACEEEAAEPGPSLLAQEKLEGSPRAAPDTGHGEQFSLCCCTPGSHWGPPLLVVPSQAQMRDCLRHSWSCIAKVRASSH